MGIEPRPLIASDTPRGGCLLRDVCVHGACLPRVACGPEGSAPEGCPGGAPLEPIDRHLPGPRGRHPAPCPVAYGTHTPANCGLCPFYLIGLILLSLT